MNSADDIIYTLLVGLATAYWVNLITRSPAAPGWLIRLRKSGKPWSCKLCMSLWVGLVFSFLQVLILPSYSDLPQHISPLWLGFPIAVVIITSAVAMVSLIIVSWLEHVEPLIIN